MDSNPTDALYHAVMAAVPKVVPPIFGLTAVIGSFGNILVIIVILANKTMRNTPNILILNLAVADLLFLIFCVPFTAVRWAVDAWPFGEAACKIVFYLTNVTLFGSAYTLVLMAISRYMAIVRPIRSLVVCTPRNTYAAIAVMWTAILSGAVYYALAYSLFNMKKQRGNHTHEYSVCSDKFVLNDPYFPYRFRIYSVCLFTFGYAIPLLFISVIYSVTVRHLVNNAIPTDEKVKSIENARTKRRIAIMVGVVIAVFAVCWFPNLVMMMVNAYLIVPELDGWFYLFFIASNCLAYLNSCVNPVIYALLSRNFRKKFRNLLCCSDRDIFLCAQYCSHC